MTWMLGRILAEIKIRTKPLYDCQIKYMAKLSSSFGEKTNFKARLYSQKEVIANWQRKKGNYACNQMYDGSRWSRWLCKFTLLTVATKFSQASVFSGFNQPNNISYDSRFDALCGISKDELLSVFKEQIRELGENNGMTEEETIEKLKSSYNYKGYTFL